MIRCRKHLNKLMVFDTTELSRILAATKYEAYCSSGIFLVAQKTKSLLHFYLIGVGLKISDLYALLNRITEKNGGKL